MRRFAACLLSLVTLALPCHAQQLKFAARQDITTALQDISGVAVADFNGDGRPDIALTDAYSKQLTVYLNDGKGNFGTALTQTLSYSALGGGALVAGDVNEDGKQDLILATIAGNQASIVLLGNGDGTFTTGQTIPGSFGFFEARLVDINGDKHLDLIDGANGNLYVHLGDGKGNFSNQQLTNPGTGDIFFSVASGDFNKDGHPDFAVTTYNGSSIRLFTGNGDGTFRAPTDLPLNNLFQPSSLQAADFLGNGASDLIVGEASIVLRFRNNGDGSFKSAPDSLPFSPPLAGAAFNSAPVVAVADMNLDGSLDVVSANSPSQTMEIALNRGSGSFDSATPDVSVPMPAGEATFVRVADLNGDGIPDVVVAFTSTKTVSVFLSVPVKSTPALTVSSNAAQVLTGNTVTVTVQVSKTGAATAPSGTVTLFDGNTSLGQQTLDTTGKAAFSLTALSVGSHALTVMYSGDSKYLAATSAVFNQAVTDFSVALAQATQTVSPGATATYTLNVGALGGFTGSVAFTCSGLPSSYSCASSPVSLNAASGQATISVAPSATAARSRAAFAGVVGLLWIPGMLLLARRRPRLQLLLAALVLVVTASLSGCGSSGPSKSVYRGSSNFTITATATQGGQSVSHAVTATLTVQ